MTATIISELNEKNLEIADSISKVAQWVGQGEDIGESIQYLQMHDPDRDFKLDGLVKKINEEFAHLAYQDETLKAVVHRIKKSNPSRVYLRIRVRNEFIPLADMKKEASLSGREDLSNLIAHIDIYNIFLKQWRTFLVSLLELQLYPYQ
ncbi:TPA: hypothetical protein I7682_17930 [Vibrio vulnificus]|nr:hypothetical protein [Vibrio vulnificus]